MNKIKTYTDAKDFPLWNFKRILQTGNFLFVIKGYDEGDEIEVVDIDLEKKFNEIEESIVLSLNKINVDLISIGTIERSKLDIQIMVQLLNIIELKQKEERLSKELGLEYNFNYDTLFENIKIQRSADINVQKNLIIKRIKRLETTISTELKKIKNKENKSDSEFDIDRQIVNVKIGLEIDFDERKTSIYQYSMYCQALADKVEQLNKVNNG